MVSHDSIEAEGAQDQILARLARHLDGLAARVHALEHTLGTEIADLSSSSEATITQLQTLDFLRQSLEDCAMLSLLLNKHGNPSAFNSIDRSILTSKLRLETTKDLVLGSAFAKVYPVQPDGGDVDLF